MPVFKISKWLCLSFLLVWISCSKNTQSDIDEIVQYLEDHEISYIESSDVYIHIEEQGSDVFPTEESIVEIQYQATYLNGVVFDQSPEDTPIKLNLQDAIQGLSIGMKFISVGGQGSIYIPSSLAYGSNPPFGIEKNAILVYHIRLINII
ncbi:MAG: FKBP-type peptidyl-prolyl cis-trans isomerase [Chitinophagales bacterium]|nr:FKBP-type peptidyl-prolyl cis-trans isomerase [Chitinophagales bacterium]